MTTSLKTARQLVPFLDSIKKKKKVRALKYIQCFRLLLNTYKTYSAVVFTTVEAKDAVALVPVDELAEATVHPRAVRAVRLRERRVRR